MLIYLDSNANFSKQIRMFWRYYQVLLPLEFMFFRLFVLSSLLEIFNHTSAVTLNPLELGERMIVIRVKDQEFIEWWKTITYDRISRNFSRVSVAELIPFDMTRHITVAHIHVNLSFSININTTFLIFNLPNKVYVSIGS